MIISKYATIGLTVAGVSAFALGTASAQDRPYDGMTLNVASMNDPFAFVLQDMLPRFQEETGIEVRLNILSYPELLSRVTADFVGGTQGFDIVTTDNVWTGQFADAGHTVVLNDWIERDAAEIRVDDIYPVLMTSLGNFEGQQVAFPFAGYANVLVYREDLYSEAGLEPPETMEQLVEAAYALTQPEANQYGWVANGQRGPAVAQDWMQYNAQMGGSIMGDDGLPALNSPENVESLRVYKSLFDDTTPPGAVEYDWGGREESFRQGLVANQQTWSVASATYDNPEMSRVVGQVGIILAPTGEGLESRYGVGGWGLGINADVDDRRQEAAWEFVKWVTSPAIQLDMAEMGGGGYIRISTVTAPELQDDLDFLPVVHQSFTNGDGEFRPRIPQYPEIQDILGDAVNSVLVGDRDPQEALDDAQARVMERF